MKKFKLAIRDYDAVLKGSPRTATSLYGRSLAERAIGELAEASADQVAAIQIDSGVVR